MAFTVQDDDGSQSGANAYASLAEVRAYHLDRGTDLSAIVDADLEAAIVKATDYLDARFSFIGEKRTGASQNTQWPRIGAYDRDRSYINGIPNAVKEATSEYANRALTADINPDPTYDATGATVKSKAESVGPISEEVTYVEGSRYSMPKYPVADAKLTRLGLTLQGGNVRRA